VTWAGRGDGGHSDDYRRSGRGRLSPESASGGDTVVDGGVPRLQGRPNAGRSTDRTIVRRRPGKRSRSSCLTFDFPSKSLFIMGYNALATSALSP
jgi:hypothetical protein